MVYGWGGSYEQHAMDGGSSASVVRSDLPEVQGQVGVSSFRRVLGTPFDARRFGLAGLGLMQMVGEASGAEGIGAAGQTTVRGLGTEGRGTSDSVGEGGVDASNEGLLPQVQDIPHSLPGVPEGGVDACPECSRSLSQLWGTNPLGLEVVPLLREGDGKLDACPAESWKLAALTAFNVDWAYQVGLIVEFRESSCITLPDCVVGLAGERGPFQFMLDTWLGTPYAEYDRCNPIAAWRAFAWMLSEDPGNGPRHWTTWPR